MSSISKNKPEYNYSFSALHCATCNKALGNIGFYIDRPIDVTPAELFDDLMIENGIHYEIKCEECMLFFQSPATPRLSSK